MDSIDILQKLSSSVAEAILEATDNGILIIDSHRKVVTYNNRFLELWTIPSELHNTDNDDELLAFALDQLSYPQIFSDKVQQLYQQPTHESFDTIHFKDGRIVERFSRPMYLEGEVVARVWSFRDVTMTETIKHELAKEVAFRKTIIQTLPDLVWLKDPSGVYLACNPRFEALYGVVEKKIIGKTDYDFVDKELADFFRDHDKKAMEKNAPSINEEWLTFAHDGHRELVETTKTPMYNDQKELMGVLGIGHDITKRNEKEEEFKTIFNVSKDGMAILDQDSNFLDFNNAYLEMTGFTREELLSKSCIGLSAPEDVAHAIKGLETILKEGFIKNFEKTCIVKNGKKIVINMTITLMPDQKRILVSTKDVTQAKEHEHQLEHIAHYDPLTDLPNRVLNGKHLRHTMLQAQQKNQKIAILYLDLDGFKEVNDHYGHSVGDQLLMILAANIQHALREGDALSRLGGDEFVIILPNMGDTTMALAIIEKLLITISQTITIDTLLVHVSASIGVTFYPQEEEVDADQLIRQADQAMYSAKQSGKNRYHIFDPERDRTIRTRHENLERIEQALKNREFILYYQPKVNIQTGKLIGAEALIRWQHPTKGIIAPLEFLPFIENHPLSIEVGEWVIDETITQIEQWHALGLNIPISVNVGARQLLQGNFVQRLKGILAKHTHFDPALLEIEILETSALENISHASHIIETCKTMGISFALDDFGTGYSSLTYLKRLPVKTLKIDQSFVRDMLDDRDSLAILEGIVGLAKAFNRELIAEGVETYEHGKQLLALGCHLLQGYGIARPMPPEKLVAWSQKWCKDHEWLA